MHICGQDRDEAKRQLTAHQKIIDKHKEMIQKCINFTKMLLVEKVLTIQLHYVLCECAHFVAENSMHLNVVQFPHETGGLLRH